MLAKTNRASRSRQVFNLRGSHITTTDFAQVSPVYKRLLTPGDKFNIRQSLLCRVAPMQFPTYGSIQIVNKAFFVPLRTVWKYFPDFKDGVSVQIDTGTIGSPKVPYISITDLFNVFLDSALSGNASNTTYDFLYFADSESSASFRKLTRLGRYWYKVLRSLGYPVTNMSNVIHLKSSDQDEVFSEQRYSALPLLCFFKIYLDCLCPSQFSPSNPLRGVLEESSATLNYHLDAQTLTSLINSFKVPYNDDLITLAWQKPYQVLDGYQSALYADYGNESSKALDSTSLPSSYLGTLATGDSSVGSGVEDNILSAATIRVALAVQNFITRNNLAGSRYVEQVLSRFGIHIPHSRLDMAEYIGEYRVPLTIGDITNTAETKDGSPLGSFAGQAIGYNNAQGAFTYECEEDGYIFVLQYLQPETTHVEGVDRDNLFFDRTQFFHPEFDNLGTEAISAQEVYIPPMVKLSSTFGYSQDTEDGMKSANIFNPNGVFGFAPMYYDYKFGKSRLTGDFLVPTLSTGTDSMHLFRLLGFTPWLNTEEDSDPSFYAPDVVAQNQDLVFSEQKQFDRIFAVTEDNIDHFYITNNFDVIAERPMATLAQSLPMTEQGSEVSTDFNGSSNLVN